MKFVTVRAQVGADGNIKWFVWTGMKMIEKEWGRWVRGHSLLRFPLDPKFNDLVGSNGIVLSGILYKQKVEEEGRAVGWETSLQRLLKPQKFRGLMYIALEIEDPSGMIRTVGSFNTRFERPEEYALREHDNRLSYVWQIELSGGLIITTSKGTWRARLDNKGKIIVALDATGAVLAKEHLYPFRWVDPLPPGEIPERVMPEWKVESRLIEEYQATQHRLRWLEHTLSERGLSTRTSRYYPTRKYRHDSNLSETHRSLRPRSPRP